MAKSNSRRVAALKRRPARLESRPTILVICEGEKTEPDYLNRFRLEQRNGLVHLEIIDGAGVPKTIVERAVALKRAAEANARKNRHDFERYDEVWCVFDVDDHPIDEALVQARDNGINVAISNPCFELWIYLHLQAQTAEIHRHALQSCCKRLLAGFEKAIDAKQFAVLMPAYAEAVARAKQLLVRNTTALKKEAANPATTVFRLTERIRFYGSESQLQRLSSRTPPAEPA